MKRNERQKQEKQFREDLITIYDGLLEQITNIRTHIEKCDVGDLNIYAKYAYDIAVSADKYILKPKGKGVIS